MSLDLQLLPHDDILARVEHVFDLTLGHASVVHGIYGDTEGFRSSRDTWVRIERRHQDRIKSAAWIGLEAASTIRRVPKPAWHQSATWADPDREQVWRADELEFIASPSVKAAGGLDTASSLPDAWWQDLRDALAALAEHETERVGMSQAHLTKRISQVFPDVDTTVDEWRTAHTDMQWSNLTLDGHILDWEDWGSAPRGHDAATLWQASLPDPALTARVEREFATDLQTRSGKLSLLLRCANASRLPTTVTVTAASSCSTVGGKASIASSLAGKHISAECVVEAPIVKGAVAALANFRSATFNSCQMAKPGVAAFPVMTAPAHGTTLARIDMQKTSATPLRATPGLPRTSSGPWSVLFRAS